MNMRKWMAVLMLLLIIWILPQSALAAEPAFRFSLSVDGKTIKEVDPGDIVTVSLYLTRTDSSDGYTMYAMQDELRYDSSFFHLVSGSQALNKGIQANDISVGAPYREFYMNYLSMDGGVPWENRVLAGSFQLEVIAGSGSSQIANRDYLVSRQDGSGSYSVSAEDVTVVIRTYAITFDSKGGSKVASQQLSRGQKITEPAKPTRLGYTFSGWYKDAEYKEKWDFSEDTVPGAMTLYAKWVKKSVVTPGTGDAFHMGWPAAMVVSGTMLLALLELRRRRNRKETRP